MISTYQNVLIKLTLSIVAFKSILSMTVCHVFVSFTASRGRSHTISMPGVVDEVLVTGSITTSWLGEKFFQVSV